jgi:hypothetical protein
MTAKYVMRYLSEHKITFIHNPKTAGTSISRWLDNNFKTVAGRKHGHHKEVAEFFPDTVFTFGVVRNPWERLASWYQYANHSNETFQDWFLYRLQPAGPGLRFNPEVSWSLQWYTLGTPQADWFGDNVNMVLKFENLEQDFLQIKTLLTNYDKLPIINNNIIYDYRTLYNNDLIDLVKDVYMKDVIRYNYDFEI